MFDPFFIGYSNPFLPVEQPVRYLSDVLDQKQNNKETNLT